MRATVLLQTVCNALVQGQRLFLTMSQICQLEGGSGEEVRVSVIDGWSKDGILQLGWSDI